MNKYYIPVWSSILKPGDIEVEKKVLAEIDAQVEYIATKEEFLQVAGKADAVITADSNIDAEIIENLQKCQIIVRQGMGVDNIDLKTAAQKNITVCNVPDYCIDEVADHTMALIMAITRRIPMYLNNVAKGIWDIKSVPKINRLSTLVLGLVGFGRTAKDVAKRAQAFGFKMIAFDPYIDSAIAKEYGVELKSLEELLQTSDIVSIHMPLTKDNKHLFNQTKFALMKPNAYLVNASRGPLINEQDLYEAVKNKVIAGAALDVLEEEPPALDHPLLSLDNVLITPHAAFYSEDSYLDLRRKAALEVKRVLSNQKPLNPVN